MPTWVPKVDAPESFNLAQAFAAGISGNPTWGWLTPWLPLLGEQFVNTAEFCAKGPALELEPLESTDFLTGDRNPLASIGNKALLALKLRDAAYDFVFAGFCELPSEGTGCDVAFQHSYVAGGPKTEWTVISVDPLEVPAAATSVNFSRSGADCNIDAYWGTVPNSPFNHFISGGGITTAYPPGQSYSVDRSQPCNYLYIAGEGAGVGELTVRFCGPGLGAETYTPVPQPRPVGVLDPTTKTYSSIADLGAELDAQELKLDHLLAIVQWLTGVQASPQMAEELPDDIEDAVIPSNGAQGFVVRLYNIPPAISSDFPVPGRLHRAGWAEITTPYGHLPAIELTQAEMVIAPIPPWANGLVVHVYPPISGTVSRLRPTK